MKDIEFYNCGFCSYHGRNTERPVIRDEINSFIYSHYFFFREEIYMKKKVYAMSAVLALTGFLGGGASC